MEERIRKGFPGQRMKVLPPAVERRCRSIPVVRDLYITRIGHFPSAAHHFVERPDGVDDLILIYCSGGAGFCEINGERWIIKAGSTLLIPPSVPHVYGASGEAPWSIYWVHLRGERLNDYLEMLSVSRASNPLYVPDVQLIVTAFEEAYTHIDGGHTNDGLAGLSTAIIHMLGLLKCRQRAPHIRGRRSEDKILESIEHMRRHLHQSKTIDDLSRAVGMSSSHYSHQFRDQIGASPVKFFIRLKMQRACELLDFTDHAVGEIASRVGYTDPFHFSHMFKRVIGQSPTDYRNIIKG